MTPEITTLDPLNLSGSSRTLLSQDGFDAILQALNPGNRLPLSETNPPAPQLLFVVEGEATVCSGEVNTILSKDQVFLVRPGSAGEVFAHAGPASILRIQVPPRQVVTPQIISPV